MKLGEAKAFYLDSLELRRMAVSSIKGQNECLKNFMAYALGIGMADVREATAEQLLGFKQWLNSRRKSNGQPLSVRYQNKNMRAAAHMFRYLFEQERILVEITRHMPTVLLFEMFPQS